jgi:hypothetical protein
MKAMAASEVPYNFTLSAKHFAAVAEAAGQMLTAPSLAGVSYLLGSRTTTCRATAVRITQHLLGG